MVEPVTEGELAIAAARANSAAVGIEADQVAAAAPSKALIAAGAPLRARANVAVRAVAAVAVVEVAEDEGKKCQVSSDEG